MILKNSKHNLKNRTKISKKLLMALLFLGASGLTLAQAEEHRKDQAAHRAAFEACHEELGIAKPEAGTRPQAMDEAVREKMDACLKEKGFEPPKFGRRGPPREGQEHDGQRPPPPPDEGSFGFGGVR